MSLTTIVDELLASKMLIRGYNKSSELTEKEKEEIKQKALEEFMKNLK